MKPRGTLLTIALVAAAVGLGALAEPQTRPDRREVATGARYQVDPVHSTVIFKIKHLGVSYFYGRFNGPTASFSFDPDDPAASSFEIVLKAENVDTGAKGRDDHLKSPDFFNAKQFPRISFKSTRVRGSRDKLRVTGDLSMHGVTRPITLDMQYVGTGTHPRSGKKIAGFDASFTLKRSDFEIDYMLQGLGDEVTLMVGLEGALQ
jgi:polyisoprenoid-binding protein YceI